MNHNIKYKTIATIYRLIWYDTIRIKITKIRMKKKFIYTYMYISMISKVISWQSRRRKIDWRYMFNKKWKMYTIHSHIFSLARLGLFVFPPALHSKPPWFYPSQFRRSTRELGTDVPGIIQHINWIVGVGMVARGDRKDNECGQARARHCAIVTERNVMGRNKDGIIIYIYMYIFAR